MYQKYLNLELLGTGYFGYKHGLLCQSGSNINIEKVTVTSFFHGIAIRTSNVNIKNIIANNRAGNYWQSNNDEYVINFNNTSGLFILSKFASNKCIALGL